jgi:hypothetical protein
MKLLFLAAAIYFTVNTYTTVSATIYRTVWFRVFIAFRIVLILFLIAAFFLLP